MEAHYDSFSGALRNIVACSQAKRSSPSLSAPVGKAAVATGREANEWDIGSASTESNSKSGSSNFSSRHGQRSGIQSPVSEHSSLPPFDHSKRPSPEPTATGWRVITNLDTKRPFPSYCFHPQCPAGPFNRLSDLADHYEQHQPPNMDVGPYRCDYPECDKRGIRYRHIHLFRHHLREFHGETAPYEAKEDTDSIHMTEANIFHMPSTSEWWRCSRCLRRSSDMFCAQCFRHRAEMLLGPASDQSDRTVPDEGEFADITAKIVNDSPNTHPVESSVDGGTSRLRYCDSRQAAERLKCLQADNPSSDGSLKVPAKRKMDDRDSDALRRHCSSMGPGTQSRDFVITPPDADPASSLCVKAMDVERHSSTLEGPKLHARACAMSADLINIDESDESDEESESDFSTDTWLSSESGSSLDKSHPLYSLRADFLRKVIDVYDQVQEASTGGSAPLATGMGEGFSDVSGFSGHMNQDAINPRRTQVTPVSQANANSNTTTKLHYACPFLQRDLHRHLYRHLRCYYRKPMAKISHVKQHIKRYHKQSKYCVRCGLTFDSADELDGHHRFFICQFAQFTPPEGATESQLTQFSRKVSSKLSEEEQWYAVFDILFPGEPHPESPFVDLNLFENALRFQYFVVAQAPHMLVEYVNSRDELRWNLPTVDDNTLRQIQTHVLAEGLNHIFTQAQSSSEGTSALPPTINSNRHADPRATPGLTPWASFENSSDETTLTGSTSINVTSPTRAWAVGEAASLQPRLEATHVSYQNEDDGLGDSGWAVSDLFCDTQDILDEAPKQYTGS